MKKFKISKKEAIENLMQKMKELADNGDIAGVAQCKAQIDAVRHSTIQSDNHPIIEINKES